MPTVVNGSNVRDGCVPTANMRIFCSFLSNAGRLSSCKTGGGG